MVFAALSTAMISPVNGYRFSAGLAGLALASGGGVFAQPAQIKMTNKTS
jgi:hypothetical protein